jgi:hypothetical protein
MFGSMTVTVSPLPMPRLEAPTKLHRAAPEIAMQSLAAVDDGDMVGEGHCRPLQIGERRQRLMISRVLAEILFVELPILPGA